MTLLINKAPDFDTAVCKNIISNDNNTKQLTTEELLQGVDEIHAMFKAKGWYDLIKNSKLFTKGE